MSTDTETAQAAEDTARDAGLLIREFGAELSAGEGRTIDVRIVPYGERITHNDGRGGVPKGVPYDEEWEYGAFADQVRAAGVGRANKVWLNFEHRDDLLSQVGHGMALREEADGFHGTFELHDDIVGQKALLLVREGVVDGVSLEAKPLKSVRGSDGVVRRVKAHLYGLALTRFPAYQNARVLAVREEMVEETALDPSLLPIDPDPALIERLRAQGVALPDRYRKAHPDETGTPDQAGTPEDGTRQPTDTTSSED